MSVRKTFQDMLKASLEERSTSVPKNGMEVQFEGKNVEARLKRLFPAKSMSKDIMLQQIDWVQPGREPTIESQPVIGMPTLMLPNSAEVSKRIASSLPTILPAIAVPPGNYNVAISRLLEQNNNSQQSTQVTNTERDNNRSKNIGPRIGGPEDIPNSSRNLDLEFEPIPSGYLYYPR